MTPTGLTAVVAAYNEERRVGLAVRSLLAQQLPPGVDWESVVVAASGCTDRTGEVVRALAEADPRIRLIEDTERAGKAAALRRIFSEVRGQYAVLLNADAVAEPGAVAALLEAVPAAVGPVAVMGQCVPPEGSRTLTDRMVDLLWSIHNAFYGQRIVDGVGEHVTEELLLLSGSPLPPLPAGTVNDGAFFGRWVREVGGALAYAPGARVRVEVPSRFSAHVRQRQRIIAGHRQIASWTGRPSVTVWQGGLRDAPATLSLVWREARRVPGGLSALAALLAGEVAAHLADLPAWWGRKPAPRAWDPITSVRVPSLPVAVPVALGPGPTASTACRAEP